MILYGSKNKGANNQTFEVSYDKDKKVGNDGIVQSVPKFLLYRW